MRRLGIIVGLIVLLTAPADPAAAAPPPVTITGGPSGTVTFGVGFTIAGTGLQPGRHLRIADVGTGSTYACTPTGAASPPDFSCRLDSTVLGGGPHLLQLTQVSDSGPPDPSLPASTAVIIASPVFGVTGPREFSSTEPVVLTGPIDPGGTIEGPRLVGATVTVPLTCTVSAGTLSIGTLATGTFACSSAGPLPAGTYDFNAVERFPSGTGLEYVAGVVVTSPVVSDPPVDPGPVLPPVVDPPGPPTFDPPDGPPTNDLPGNDPGTVSPPVGPPSPSAPDPSTPGSVPPSSDASGAPSSPSFSPVAGLDSTVPPAPAAGSSPSTSGSTGDADGDAAVQAGPRLTASADAPGASPIDLTMLGVAVLAISVLLLSRPGGLGASAGPAHSGSGSWIFGRYKGKGEERRGYERSGQAWGDRSVTWRAPGHRTIDRWSLSVPRRMAPHLPLTARLLADGTYLRAVIGTLWWLLPVAGLTLGLVAAGATDHRPVPPALGLVVAVLVLAAADALAGAVAATTFAIAVLVAGGLTAGTSLAEGSRGLVALTALWFVVPVVACVARPFRRTRRDDERYSWDRLADAVIGVLFGTWATYGIAISFDYLLSEDVELTRHAGWLAIIAAGALTARYACEESTVHSYPERLRAVLHPDAHPPPTRSHEARGIVVQLALMVLIASAFIGWTWHIWVASAILGVPELVALARDRFPSWPIVDRVLPRGLMLVFCYLVYGALLTVALKDSDLTTVQALRVGFVLATVPRAVYTLASLFGTGSAKTVWTWPRQLIGVLLVAASTAIVVASWVR